MTSFGSSQEERYRKMSVYITRPRARISAGTFGPRRSTQASTGWGNGGPAARWPGQANSGAVGGLVCKRRCQRASFALLLSPTGARCGEAPPSGVARALPAPARFDISGRGTSLLIGEPIVSQVSLSLRVRPAAASRWGLDRLHA